MIPQLVTVRIQGPHKRHRIWIPLFPVYLILAPLLPLIIIGAVVACARYRINPFKALLAATRMLTGLAGLHVDVAQGTTNVLVKLT